MDIETNIRMTKREIERHREEIRMLKEDSLRVRSERIKDFIGKKVESLDRTIERREFKLWKLEREE